MMDLPTKLRSRIALARDCVARKFRRFAPYVREFFAILMIVIVPPFLIFSLSFYYQKFDDTFMYAFHCLWTSLLFYHLFFFARRSRSTKHVTKLIDYVYLSVAALGLFSAADFSSKRYQAEVTQAIHQTTDTMKGFEEIHQKAIESMCGDHKHDEDCQALHELVGIAKDAKVTLPESPLLYNADLFLSKMTKIADSSKLIAKLEMESEPNIYDDFGLVRRLRDEPFGYDSFHSRFNFEGLRIIGFYLLASALALRLTRVTIEIWGWQRKD